MFDEAYDLDETFDAPADWGENGYPETEIESDWEDRSFRAGMDGYGDEELFDALPDDRIYETTGSGIGSWPRFLFLATFLACMLLAGLLSLVTFNASSAGASPQAKQGPVLAQDQPTPAVQPEPDPAADSSDQVAPDSECLVSDRFPGKILQWCGLISQYASKRGLPPDLVAALILQESGGNPTAYSQSGAVGLMQVMPRDGLAASFMCASGPCFANRPSTSELKDPAFNVSYGTKMLAGLVGKHGGLRDALKAYGPMNVGYYYADIVMGLYQRYGN